jgi:hypothetical protein
MMEPTDNNHPTGPWGIFTTLLQEIATLPPILRYGGVIIVAILTVILFGIIIPEYLIWPLVIIVFLCLAAFVFIDWNAQRQSTGQNEDSVKPKNLSPKHPKTGDKQIDDVLGALNDLHKKHGDQIHEIDENILMDLFSHLFVRDAFQDVVERTNPNGWKALLYVVTATELILRDYRLLLLKKKSGKIEIYDELLTVLGKLQTYITGVFEGCDPSTMVANPEIGLDREKFINQLLDFIHFT